MGFVRLVVLLVLACCHAPLGANDEVLVFDSPDVLESMSLREVIWRLSLHRTHAEVTLDGPSRLRVLIDGARADDAALTLAKPGGLAIYRLPDVKLEYPIVTLRWPHARSDGKHVQIALDADEIKPLLAEPPDTQIAVTWNHQIMWRGVLATSLHPIDGELEILAGHDLAAYRRARDQAKLYASPPLPVLKLVAREPQPIDWPLLLGVIGLPIGVAVAWLFFVRRFDRARPEPWWLLLVTIALGAAVAPVAGVIERLLAHTSPLFDPTAMCLDLSARAFPIGLLVFTLVVGVVEEGVKLLAAWGFAMHRREFDEPIDGIVFAAAAAIGFATAENVLYFTLDRFSGGLFTVRSLTCVSGHFMFAAIWGYALGQRMVRPKARILPYFALAALLHGLWDTSIEFELGHYTELAQMIVLTIVFTVLVRSALRWGVIDKSGARPARSTAKGGAEVDDKSPQPTQRTRFRLGRRRGFAVAIIAMFAFGWRLQATAVAFGRGTTRVDLEVLAWLALYGTLFIMSVWALTAAIPLDAVIDEAGVTFAGASRTWSEISGVKRVDDRGIVIESTRGDLELRPGSKAIIDQLVAAVTSGSQRRG